MAGLQDVLNPEKRKILQNCNINVFEHLFLQFTVTNKIIGTSQQALRRSLRINPSQPNDAMWRHTFHLPLICMSFAH
jgi:hypothetical protein